MRIWGFPNKLALLQALNGTHWIFYVAASPDSTYFNLSTIALFRYVRLGENEWLKWWLLLAFNYYLYANLVYNQCTDFAARAGARSFLIRSEKEKSIVLGWATSMYWNSQMMKKEENLSRQGTFEYITSTGQMCDHNYVLEIEYQWVSTKWYEFNISTQAE